MDILSYIQKTYRSEFDGKLDWCRLHIGGTKPICLVYLHGHGSHADQIWWRSDIRFYQQVMLDAGVYVLSPNLRDNSWMNPAAVADLEMLLKRMKSFHGCEKIIIVSGSMGGTGALVFSALHPELVDGVGVLGAATSMPSYLQWCQENASTRPVAKEIGDAISAAYSPEELERHDVCKLCDRLKMPIWYWHGGADEIIPVEQGRRLAALMADKKNFHYTEIPGGNHDSPLPYYPDALQRLLGEI